MVSIYKGFHLVLIYCGHLFNVDMFPDVFIAFTTVKHSFYIWPLSLPLISIKSFDICIPISLVSICLLWRLLPPWSQMWIAFRHLYLASSICTICNLYEKSVSSMIYTLRGPKSTFSNHIIIPTLILFASEAEDKEDKGTDSTTRILSLQ